MDPHSDLAALADHAGPWPRWRAAALEPSATP